MPTKIKKDKNNLDNLRHSCSHLLAAAVTNLWPTAKPTLGPPIDEGFYYDFDFGKINISDKDLPKIEAGMKKIVSSWKKVAGKKVSEARARTTFAGNEYKQELIDEFVADKQPLSIFTSGTFTDLCRGGHIENPSNEIKHFKLLSIAGAYWRGDEKNKMLTRIYGTCFPTSAELDDYLRLIEEAKKRDHRKIGKRLNLFAISDQVGPGLILWLPKGNIIKDELEQWVKQVEHQWGYKRVSTPHIAKAKLYHTSGHLPFYEADMFPPMKLREKEDYYLKPMNCPHHHMIYSSKKRSYKELPLRLAEYGVSYRYEASGELFGLMRVRSFATNDAHIYCTLKQAADEFYQVMKLHEYFYKSLGINKYHLEIGLRDPKNKKKYHGSESMWKRSEELMRKACSKIKIEMVEKVGGAAFYGPKIDFVIHSSVGRQFAISTNQIDLYMGKRFDLSYTDSSGKEQIPAIIHRAPLGSHERFIGFLIEHWGGNFPVWLSPVQIKVIPITQRNTNFSQKISDKLTKAGIRVEADTRNETLQAKIRSAQLEKIPYMGIIGDKEEKTNKVRVRARSGKDLGLFEIDKLSSKILGEIDEKKLS